MSEDPWVRGTFEGTERAQAAVIAALTPDDRMSLLEELLALALSSGALQREREDKQRALNAIWTA